MKILYSLYLCFVVALTSRAQSVDFDIYVSPTNNDLVNNFTGINLFTQSQTGGITGGAVKPPSYGDSFDRPTFTHAINLANGVTIASICFKNQSALATDFASQPVLIAFVYTDNLGSKHGVEFRHDPGSLEIMGIGNGSGGCMIPIGIGDALKNDRWYQLKAEVEPVPGLSPWLGRLRLYDIGTSGMSTPTLVASNDCSIINFSGVNSVKVELFAEETSGTQYLDNFNISNYPTGISDQSFASKIFVPSSLEGGTLHIGSQLNTPVTYQLYSISGSVLRHGVFTKAIEIDCSDLPASQYYIKLSSELGFMTKKIVKF